jgi:hypothetical protein
VIVQEEHKALRQPRVRLRGLENWTSTASAYKIDQADVAGGLGFRFLLDQFMDKLVVSTRLAWMGHADAVFPQRDFHGIDFKFGCTVVY